MYSKNQIVLFLRGIYLGVISIVLILIGHIFASQDYSPLSIGLTLVGLLLLFPALLFGIMGFCIKKEEDK